MLAESIGLGCLLRQALGADGSATALQGMDHLLDFTDIILAGIAAILLLKVLIITTKVASTRR